MNEQYDMEAFDEMVFRSKADLHSHYRRNVHDGMLHGWIEAKKHSAAEIAKARKVIDLLLVAAKPHLKRKKGEPRPGQAILKAAIRQADDYLKETEEVTG
jgi:hypothetical protein